MNTNEIVSENASKSSGKRPVLMGSIVKASQVTPARETLADGINAAITEAESKGMIDIAAEVEPFAIQPRYVCNNKGVFYIGVKTVDGATVEAEPMRLADPIELVGSGTDAGGHYYRVIQYRDKLTRQSKTAAIPSADIGSSNGFQRLQAWGITVYSGRAKRERLADYLQTEGSKERYTITNKAGWHDGAYILPSGEIIQPDKQNDKVIYHGDKSRATAYAESGSLEEWQREIAQYAAGNSRLCLALGAAFAAPLLPLINSEGGGFHIHGDSGTGKTTAANVAQSVWCTGGKDGRLTWDSTVSSVELSAAARNHNLVVPDEVGEARSAAELARAVYKLANGQIKGRATTDGQNRPQITWTVLVLSTGEHSLAEFVTDNGGKWNAGQNNRIPSIPAAAGSNGIVENLHGFSGSALFVDHLNEASAHYHGTAGRAFIAMLVKDTEAAKEQIKAMMQEFTALLPANVGRQAGRVVKRFALAAAALALAEPITGISKLEAYTQIKKCFDAWFKIEGAGDYETRKGIQAMAEWIASNAQSERIINIGNQTKADQNAILPRDFAGYRQHSNNPEDPNSDILYLQIPVYRNEIAKGIGEDRLEQILVDTGWQKPRTKDNRKGHKALGLNIRFQVIHGLTPPEE